MRDLSHVTLIGVDCVDIRRLLHVAEICQREIQFGAVKLLSSIAHPHPSVVAIDPVMSRAAYSAFVLKQLNSYVDTPFALVIQYDGFILNPAAWHDEYLDYDYIGAPWWVDQQEIVGNGGFSMRSKRLLSLLQNDPAIQLPADEAEDWYICVLIRDMLEAQGIRFAPSALAKQFSIEGGDEQSGVCWTDQFGFHGLRWTDISGWLQAHPADQIDNTLDESTLALKAKLGL